MYQDPSAGVNPVGTLNRVTNPENTGFSEIAPLAQHISFGDPATQALLKSLVRQPSLIEDIRGIGFKAGHLPGREARAFYGLLTVRGDKSLDVVALELSEKLKCSYDTAWAAIDTLDSEDDGQGPDDVLSIAQGFIAATNRRAAFNDLAALADQILPDDQLKAELERLAGLLTPAVQKRRIERTLAGVRERSLKLLSDVHAGTVTGVPLGLPGLNEILMPGELCIVAARPGGGKTALAVQIARRNAQAGKRVMFVSLEMTEAQLFFRIVAPLVNVDCSILRHANTVATAEIERVMYDSEKLGDLPLSIQTTDINRICDVLRAVHDHGEVDLLIVDYLQIVDPDTVTGHTRDHVITEICKVLKKGIAQKLSIPVIALCQVNREGGKRGGCPTLEDLRESGGIESYADSVITMCRPVEKLQAKLDEVRADPKLTGEKLDQIVDKLEADIAEVRDVIDMSLCKNRWGDKALTRGIFKGKTSEIVGMNERDYGSGFSDDMLPPDEVAGF